MEGKTCWSCGNYLIGGGCWKDGDMGEKGWKDVGPNDSCSAWVDEETPGTIMGTLHENVKEEGNE